MATLNKPAGYTGITTHEGAPAKRIDAEAQLRRSVMACLLWESQFYESGASIADRIAQGVQAVSQEIAAAIAVEAREVMHLRHVPLFVVREMARRGGKIVGDTLARVIQRPDELTEFLAIYWKDGKQPLSAQVKRGLAEAFTKFDAYQLAKYARPKSVRLRDVLFLSHAKPQTDEHRETWPRLIDGTLEAPDTWEVALSGGADKKEAWGRLLSENKLGGLALLRNLRNMQQADVSRGLIRAAIAKNPFRRVLPFRFLAAAEHAPDLEPDLEQAMFRGLADMKLPGKSAIVVDVSGSMSSALSSRSQMSRQDAAAGLAIMLREMCDDVDVIVFGLTAALLPPRRGFALRDLIRSARVGHATYAHLGKQIADTRGYDRIIVITDEQVWGPGRAYHHSGGLTDPLGKGFVINVASDQNGIGYGAWTHIDGWSEGVVRYIQESESTP